MARGPGERLNARTFAQVVTSPLCRAVRTRELAGFGAIAEIERDPTEEANLEHLVRPQRGHDRRTPECVRADASSSSRLAIRPRPLRDFATRYSAAALTADSAARAEAGASTSHRISFKSSTKMENNTGTSSSVTNVASVSPPICA